VPKVKELIFQDQDSIIQIYLALSLELLDQKLELAKEMVWGLEMGFQVQDILMLSRNGTDLILELGLELVKEEI
jgi:hypothetical protein